MTRWNLFSRPDRLTRDLLVTRAGDDEIFDAHLDRILWRIRHVDPLRRRLAWWRVRFTSLVKGVLRYGRHWRARPQVHSGAPATPSPGYTPAGASYPGGFSLTVAGPDGTFEDAGIRAGEVMAFRAWRLESDGFLRSVYQEEFIWYPGEPAIGNPIKLGEGIHAFKDRADVNTYLAAWNCQNFSSPTFVTGTVDLWGDVFEHERGYRASHAAIASIDDADGYDATALRARYGLKP